MKKPTIDQMTAELLVKGKGKFLQESAEKRRMYHGSRHYPPGKMFHPEHRPSGEGIKEFKNGLRGMTFVSPDPKFSNLYAGDAKDSDFMSGAVYPVHVQVRKPFDFENADHLDVMTDELSKLSGKSPEIPAWINAGSEKIRKQLRSGNWDVIEDPLVMGIAKRLGFDGAYMNEQGVKNLGVFDPKRIKSAVGNRGTYDINDPDITKAKGGIIGMATGGSFINSLVETLPFTRPVVNALGFRKEVYDRAELPMDLDRYGQTDIKLMQDPLRSLPRSTRPSDLPTGIKAYRADPTGKFGGKEGLETLPIRRIYTGGDQYNPRNPDPATSDSYTDSSKAVQELYRHARLLGAAQKHGYPSFTPEEAAAFMLKEGRTDLGHSSVWLGSKKEKEFDDMLKKTHNLHPEDQNFLSAINAKKLVADRLGISLAEAWNGTGRNEAGQTGKDYAKNWEAQRQAALHPKNKELLDLINRAINEGKEHGLPLRANRERDEIMQRREVPYANGGIIHKAEGGSMNTPTLAQMRVQLNQRKNPNYLDSIGVDQAVDMNPKTYISPNPTQNNFMPVGGVADSNGLPVGGIDQDNTQQGQQMMAQQPDQDLQPNPSPQGTPAPEQGGTPQQQMGNMLSLTPQGQALQAMKPAGMAEGGQPTKRRTFAIKAANQQPKKEPEFTPYDPEKISIKNLSKAFDESIAHHLSLSHEDRIANSAKAAKAVGKFIGHTGDGKVKDLLGKNAKLLKTETGKNEEPIKLPDNRGVENTGVALAPAYEQSGFNTCPNSPSCKAECLGKTSGNYFKLGGGQDLSEFKGPRLNSLNKTQAFLNDPHSFAVKLHDEIQAAKDMAGANGNHLGLRLNILSDINPRVHKAIINAHPDVTFYDYTKNNTNPIAPNHHYTYSSTGVSQDGVENENSNWKQMRKRLLGGDNVAMAFSHKTHLPEYVHDEETGHKFKVINGDSHDFRPLDMQPEGEHGVIVGLKNKKATGKMNEAHIDSNGFFVHYDPKEKMTVNAKGKPIYERDKKGATIPTNKVVNIKPQKTDLKIETNDGA